jgi:ABC-type bacteriocin/lantibiotic exporter with double-glycine peptidase domain
MTLERHILPISHQPQTRTSANCGPCSLKMILDHLQILNQHRQPYSVHACNRLLKTSREFGVEEADFERVLHNLKINFRSIKGHEIEPHIQSGHPILALYLDEDKEGHYALLVGYDTKNFIFNDPWHRRRITWPKQEFIDRLKPFGNWLQVILG